MDFNTLLGPSPASAPCSCGDHADTELDIAARKLAERAMLYYTLAALLVLALIIGLVVRTIRSGGSAV